MLPSNNNGRKIPESDDGCCLNAGEHFQIIHNPPSYFQTVIFHGELVTLEWTFNFLCYHQRNVVRTCVSERSDLALYG